MAKTREIKGRMKAVGNIKRITKTMQLIANAQFQAASRRATAAKPYTQKIAELVAELAAAAARAEGAGDQPLLKKPDPAVGRELVLILTANRGLCGGYNGGVLRKTLERFRELNAAGIPFDAEAAGKKPIGFLKYQRIPRLAEYVQFEDKPAYEQVEPIAEKYIQMFVSGQVDEVQVAYVKFLTASRQMPVIETLLPLTALTPGGTKAKPQAAAAAVEYEFIPSAAEILDAIVPVAFKQRLFKCFLDAAVSEQIARRVAMKAATENAADLITTITRQYNRARQAKITKEISELIAGAEALK